MTALERAISDPRPVDGIGARSPMHGLARRSIGFADVLGQSVSATAPSAAATTVPLLLSVVAGAAQVWSLALAAVVALLVAQGVNEFTRRVAATGSLYTFVAKGLGTRASFVTGIALLTGYGFVSMFALGGAGTYAAALLARVVPGVDTSPLVLGVTIATIAAGVALVLARGIRVSTRVALVVEAVSVAIILTLVVVLLQAIAPRADWSALSPAAVSPSSLAVGVVLGLTAFVGFESAAALGVEARTPFRSIPRAIVWTVIVSGAVYVLSSTSFVLGFEVIGETMSESVMPVDQLASAFGVEWVGVLLDASITASFVACAIASMTALVRVLFSMGREGLAPAVLGNTHSRFRTPFVAVVASTPLVASIPVVAALAGAGVWDTMQVLIVVAAGGYITAYVLVCAAAPVFLRRIGELTWPPVVRSIVTVALLLGVLVVFLGEESRSERSLGVWVFLAVMVAGLAWALLRHRSVPGLRHRIGVHDEPIASDVLGGALRSGGTERSGGG
ncbi:amino acid/polyamine/organocation transporter (APC superfamily) [Labedella gwakjiensis]|uniref:APC family permease n=1 Tax=Labedella gwakjiensis TaxID=390269 RepID=A0A2P8GTF6_9MICO|nr:APC family permease [Labedella gwakjiensis]PSL37249.1 amino acid/polyamine/organocation transporter (APC superfamily) [Labedella gwakjiensis]RUQ84580.1 APC family permease [Labedella gwakjiensis]